MAVDGILAAADAVPVRQIIAAWIPPLDATQPSAEPWRNLASPSSRVGCSEVLGNSTRKHPRVATPASSPTSRRARSPTDVGSCCTPGCGRPLGYNTPKSLPMLTADKHDLHHPGQTPPQVEKNDFRGNEEGRGGPEHDHLQYTRPLYYSVRGPSLPICKKRRLMLAIPMVLARQRTCLTSRLDTANVLRGRRASQGSFCGRGASRGTLGWTTGWVDSVLGTSQGATERRETVTDDL